MLSGVTADAGVRHGEVGAEGGEEGRGVRGQLLGASDAAKATVVVAPTTRKLVTFALVDS